MTGAKEVIFMAESLKGKVAVISGVGSGFGKATAELFAAARPGGPGPDRLQRAGPQGHRRRLRGVRLQGRGAGRRRDQAGDLDARVEGNAGQLRQDRFPHQLCRRRAQGRAHRGDGRRHQPAHHRSEPHQHDHELPDLHAAVQATGLRQDHQRVQRVRPPLVAGLVGLLRGQGRPSTPSRSASTPSCGRTASPSRCWCPADPTPASRRRRRA